VVQLRQPILNLDGIARYRQGKVMANRAKRVRLQHRRSDRCAWSSAYMDALFAEDQVALSQVARDMYAEQMHVNKRLFEKGEGTKTDMLETQARLDLAEAQLTEAQDNASPRARRWPASSAWIPGQLDKLGEGFRPATLTTGSFEEWEKTARAHNHELAAGPPGGRERAPGISKNKAGHYPRVDFIATYSKGDSTNRSIPTTRIR
jgi:protease secretion system outer membrane protein